jgi:hypothetical protein
MADSIEATPLVKNYTLWANKKEKRIFLVIDIPVNIADTVVLLELKEYAEDEERNIRRFPFSDWVTLVEEKKLLTPYLPKL